MKTICTTSKFCSPSPMKSMNEISLMSLTEENVRLWTLILFQIISLNGDFSLGPPVVATKLFWHQFCHVLGPISPFPLRTISFCMNHLQTTIILHDKPWPLSYCSTIPLSSALFPAQLVFPKPIKLKFPHLLHLLSYHSCRFMAAWHISEPT